MATAAPTVGNQLQNTPTATSKENNSKITALAWVILGVGITIAAFGLFVSCGGLAPFLGGCCSAAAISAKTALVFLPLGMTFITVGSVVSVLSAIALAHIYKKN